MPITFAPAQPFSPNISTSAGETDQFTRLAPLLEQHQQAVAQAYTQQRQQGMQFASANADRMQQGSQFAAAQEQQRQLQEASLGQQAAQQDAQRQQQQAQHEQQIQAQLDMQRNEFTYKDQLELQRYKNGLSEIENSPNLTPEERGDMRLQFATKIDPYERKLAQAKIAHEKTQDEALQTAMGKQHRIELEHANFKAGTLKATSHTEYDDEGNPIKLFTFIPGVDKPEVTDMTKVDTAKRRAAAALETGTRKHEEAVAEHKRHTAEFAVKERQRIAREFDAWAEKNKDDPSKRAAINAREGNIQEEFDAAMKIYEARNPPPKTGGGTSPETDFGADAKPFQYTNPETQSVGQRAAVKELIDPVDSVMASAAPKELKEQAFVASQKAGILLGQFGSAAAMRRKDPPKHAQFMQQLADIQAALNKSREASTPSPAPTTSQAVGSAARGAFDFLIGNTPLPRPAPADPARPAVDPSVRHDPRVIQRLGFKAYEMTDQEIAQWLATQR